MNRAGEQGVWDLGPGGVSLEYLETGSRMARQGSRAERKGALGHHTSLCLVKDVDCRQARAGCARSVTHDCISERPTTARRGRD